LTDALVSDLKSKGDALLEYNYLVSETCETIRNAKAWMQPRHVSKTLRIYSFIILNYLSEPFFIAYKLDECYIRPEPYGVALIIGAWNYPLTVLLEPLLGALAAGNCILLKPSELASHTAILLAELVPKYMDPQVVRLVNTDGEGTSKLLELAWNYIFYTGSTKVGRIVYEKAAKNLTPVTLELSGKR
jgi:acyl-CoA reductase-like NAD-dependent aldehyde dehydrogenase